MGGKGERGDNLRDPENHRQRFTIYDQSAGDKKKNERCGTNPCRGKSTNVGPQMLPGGGLGRKVGQKVAQVML